MPGALFSSFVLHKGPGRMVGERAPTPQWERVGEGVGDRKMRGEAVTPERDREAETSWDSALCGSIG